MKSNRRNRNRAYYRHHRFRTIRRKFAMIKKRFPSEQYLSYYKSPRVYGALHKKKIHCSCGMCTEKTRVNGYSHSDQKKVLRMKQQLESRKFFDEESPF